MVKINMGYTHGTSIKEKEKTCTCCHMTMPNTDEYFGWKNGKHTTLKSICKICTSKKAKAKKQKNIESNQGKSLFYDGTRKCKKCGRELPNNRLYFPYDLSCKDGLRNICRECNPKYRNFLDKNYIPPKKWTEEEANLLKSVYAHYSNNDIIKNFFQDLTKKQIQDYANTHGFSGKDEAVLQAGRKHASMMASKKNKGTHMTEEAKQHLSNVLKEYYKTHDGSRLGDDFSQATREKMSKIRKGKKIWYGETNPRHIHPLNGQYNGRWAGGATQINRELRSDTRKWQLESMASCNYQCIITGKKFDNVHHLHPFRDIRDETFQQCGLDIRESVSDYTDVEIINLKTTFLALQDKYGLGVCLCKEIHKLFHDEFGYFHNTVEQFMQFSTNLINGKYNQFIKENNLHLNINYEILNNLKKD